jgi:mannose-6-phosphate isomerase-like protein (cupin superfamily)
MQGDDFMTTQDIGRHSQSDGEWLQISPGERFKIRTSTRDTGGAYTVLEFVADARYGTPMHIHDNEDEHFVILEGLVRIANGDRILDAPAGTTLTVSKGVPHAWCNLLDAPARVLVVLSPGDVEGLFTEVVARKSNDIAAILDKYGCRFVGPPLLENVHTFDSPSS